jgi:hypothetical protein
MPKPEVDVIEALLGGLDHASLAELERVLLGRLSAPEPLARERARVLGELARLLPPPILGSLPRIDRALYDHERASGAPSSHSLVGTFGSWGLACLKAASMAPNGAITGPSHPWASPLRGRSKPPPYTNQEIDDAIRACARELRHTPTTASYHAWALRRRREERAKGVWPVRIPTFGTINRRAGDWLEAVERAMDPYRRHA